MVSIVARGMGFVGVLGGVQILGSCSHCRDPLGWRHPRRVEASPTPGFFEFLLSLGEAPATYP